MTAESNWADPHSESWMEGESFKF